MTIGSDAIGVAPIAADALDIVSTNTYQFSSVVSLTEIQPVRTFQFASVISIESNQPVRTSQFAIIVGALTTRVRKYSYSRPIRIAQASPLYSLFDAPTNNED